MNNDQTMTKDQIMDQIIELEDVLETLDIGDYSYDVINYELEYLYGQLKK